MALIGRLLLRLIVVSLGAFVAIYVGSVVACVANWNRLGAVFLDAPPDSHVAVQIIFAVVMSFILSYATLIMLMPAAIGIAIAETFTIRSWIFHALNGGISIWVGWVLLARGRDFAELYDNPLAIVATGLSAGLAYWLIAGWNAGVIKPAAPVVPAAPAAPQPPNSVI
jgi:hypothetical protein